MDAAQVETIIEKASAADGLLPTYAANDFRLHSALLTGYYVPVDSIKDGNTRRLRLIVDQMAHAMGSTHTLSLGPTGLSMPFVADAADAGIAGWIYMNSNVTQKLSRDTL